MARGKHLVIRSDKDTHFTGALAQNAGEEENIVLALYTAMAATRLGAIEPAKSARLTIREITVISDENLAWEVQFYKSDDFANSDLDLDDFLFSHAFSASDGAQVGGTGAFYYNQTKLEGAYYDADGTGEIHIKLVNRSAASKSADAAGEVVVEVRAEWA